METKNYNVNITNKARKRILETGKYIYLEGNPINSIKYITKMFEFAYSLNLFPEKYPICRFLKYQKKGYRCAAFDDYIFIYSIEGKDIFLVNIIHSKRLKF